VPCFLASLSRTESHFNRRASARPTFNNSTRTHHFHSRCRRGLSVSMCCIALCTYQTENYQTFYFIFFCSWLHWCALHSFFASGSRVVWAYVMYRSRDDWRRLYWSRSWCVSKYDCIIVRTKNVLICRAYQYYTASYCKTTSGHNSRRSAWGRLVAMEGKNLRKGKF